ncbi:hypothetical protein HA72_0942 [Metallosphaera sedula]|uniref:Uncharacterized protein n=2 Tax=Metallosphaera sedula TaxID=43687 RepID=A4YFB2_METS5|nr:MULTISPECIES: hypothetical protein [Metallosphaera]ABP95114.1 hypothetical protein Msed_0942 [Metallosphaera sedula DSM 5348]AIM27100.1 hypothetical protein HA72_0942 [Metallosphaera sedula]AKV74009.1 hypothetical protein MsedA_0957 [Metallosphaera sedula]AKV76247.1 hypothetical protein MsedB_0958 [Metallosphaera sedula]AKV78501.1 hypothetical protein MsedC_0957 [Metallosphaera sedula]
MTLNGLGNRLVPPPKVAAVGYLYQGDYAIPILAMEELRKEGIDVLDLSLGALKGSSELGFLNPGSLILMAAEKRGKQELRVYRPRIAKGAMETWLEIYSNVKGYYMDINSFLKVGSSLGVLPDMVTVVECEVNNTEGFELSAWGRECLELMKNKTKQLLNIMDHSISEMEIE